MTFVHATLGVGLGRRNTIDANQRRAFGDQITERLVRVWRVRRKAD